MSSSQMPSREVIDALERGLVEVTRRAEIYEADAVTRWNPDGDENSALRLIEGGINVDSNSDERRKLDLTLENIDQKLRPNPNGGLWYDKVIKIFRGIRYATADTEVSMALIEAEDPFRSRRVLSSIGYKADLRIDDPLSELLDYEMIVSILGTEPTSKARILRQLFDQGKSILTVGVGSGSAELPHYDWYASGSTFQYGIAPVESDSPVAGAFGAAEVGSPVAGTAPVGVAPGSQWLAQWQDGLDPVIVTAALARNANGGLWVDLHIPLLSNAEVFKLMTASLDYMRFIEPIKTWEVQMGEFYIDNISTASFPDTVKITARDATKKLIGDKLARTSTFAIGTSLRTLIQGQLALAGIPVSKMSLAMGNETLTSEMSFDRGTSRWDIIKSALESFGYERFFDGRGIFIVRKYLDPSLSPVAFEFGTGPKGNLVSFELSINDSRIYNHVIVTSPPSDEDSNPVGYFGEAFVTDPNTPTYRDRIGNRVLSMDAPWISSDEEAVILAQERLKITALESYELNFSSIYYPWLEVGEIVSIKDPNAFDFEPDRFLMDTISYSLGLGPMSATGKRVTYVGSSGSPEEVIEPGE